MKNYLVAGLIAAVMTIFFIIISIPLNFFSAKSLGASSTSIMVASLYMILASIIFVVLFKGINRL